MAGYLQGAGERAVAGGWDVKRFGRDFTCPQSAISKVLFDAVLRIGDRGFNEIPKWTPPEIPDADEEELG